MFSKHRDDLGLPCDLYCSRAAGTAAVIDRKKFPLMFWSWISPLRPSTLFREQGSRIVKPQILAHRACNPSFIKQSN